MVSVTMADRPRIGLVLGGGGAKGAAEVGVLKVIEQAGIPIDYIVGTSVGSIVGGLTAVEAVVFAVVDDLHFGAHFRTRTNLRFCIDDNKGQI